MKPTGAGRVVVPSRLKNPIEGPAAQPQDIAAVFWRIRVIAFDIFPPMSW